MSLFDRWMNILKTTMEEPLAWGWFHCLCIGIMIFFIILLFRLRHNHSEKQLKIILGVYGITALILEVLKQLSCSYSVDPTYNIANGILLGMLLLFNYVRHQYLCLSYVYF
jgi:hypothetical protein